MNTVLFSQDVTLLDFLIRIISIGGLIVVVICYKIEDWIKSDRLE